MTPENRYLLNLLKSLGMFIGMAAAGVAAAFALLYGLAWLCALTGG